MIALALRYWYFIAIGSLVALLGLSQVKLSSEKEAHQKTKADNAEVLRDLADKTLKAYQAVVAVADARKLAVAELDEKHTKELNHARTENSRLADAVRTGERRLRLNATCTSARVGVPQAPGATSVVDAAGPRLDDAAERDYFRLREGISTAQQQIAGLQDYVRDVCLK
ncbi:MAG: lysis protein [Giesbergeria sp.]